MAEIAGGILAFRVFDRLARGLVGIGRAATEAFEWFDRIRFSLRELAVADLMDSLTATGEAVGDWPALFAKASQEAQRLLDWVIKLSLESPFTAEDVNQMFRLIRAYGFATEQAQDLTGIILDFAAATGFGSQVLERMGLALGQVRQRGRLAGEEIRQLINVGIPVRDIVAKALNVTTAELEKMIRQGKVLADDALPAIIEWMTRFDGASQRAVQTWMGLVANMKDVKDLNLIALFDGIAAAMMPALQGLFDFLASPQTLDMMRQWGEAIGEFLSPKAEAFLEFVQNLDTLRAILANLSIVGAGPAIAKILEIFGLIDVADMPAVASAISGISDALSDFGESIGRMLDPWLGPIKDELPGWLESLGDISLEGLDELSDIWDRFVESMEKAGEIAASETIQSITESFEQLSDWWEKSGATPVGKIVEFLLTLAGLGIQGAIALLAGAFGLLVDVLTGAGWDEIIEGLAGVLETLQGLADILTQTPLFQDFATALSQLAIMEFGPLSKRAGQLGESMADEWMDNLSQGMLDNAPDIMFTQEDVLGDLESSADVLVKQAASAMKSGGSKLIKSLGDGIEDAAPAVFTRVESALDGIIQTVTEAFDFRSPSRLFMDFGRAIMAGLGQGILSGAKLAIDQIVRATDEVVRAAETNLRISSPSQVTKEIGIKVSQGFSEGIRLGAAAPAMAFQPAGGFAGQALSTRVEQHDHWRLTVNTRARKENVVGSFETMRAMRQGAI
jgi:tape measure domain-containing protein